jgi:hypothetical protein
MFLRELKIYLLLFVLLSVAMHFSIWLDHPLEHIKSLPKSSMGWWHPFLFAFLVYLFIGVIRLLDFLFKKITKK